MKALRASLLVALVLVSAIVVVASPAFATPNITASSGTRAVAPFITPIGSTTSQFTGRSSDSTFIAPAIGATVTCRTAITSGYAGTTNTQARVTSVSFGNRSGSDCRATIPGDTGTVVGDEVTCLGAADGSTRPWFLHVIRGPDGTGSSSGTINIPAAGVANSCTFVIDFARSRTQCSIVIDNNQSIRGTYTNATSNLNVNDRTLRITSRDGPRARCALSLSTTASFTATYRIRADTPRSAAPTVTATTP